MSNSVDDMRKLKFHGLLVVFVCVCVYMCVRVCACMCVCTWPGHVELSGSYSTDKCTERQVSHCHDGGDN